jgi:hypothetical protein
MAKISPIHEHYQRMLCWVHTYPLPPSGFDALAASDRALSEFGLPARPDRRLRDGAPFRFWQRMIGPSTLFETPCFSDGTGPRSLLFAYQRRGEPALREAGHVIPSFHHRSNSRNWSGACITPIRPSRFTHITGAWSVPSVSVPSVLPSGADRLNEDYRSSTWIGLGGHRPYNSLPQIGTAQHLEIANGQKTETFFAWWQWWVKDRPEHHVPMPIMNFPVSPGDQILASVTVEASRDVVFHIKNETTYLFTTFKVVAPADIEPLGSSAEWVHERPTEFDSDRMYPLPSCEKVEFSDCVALSSRVSGGPEVVQTLSGSRLIRMTELFDDPPRCAIVSMPRLEGDTTLHVEYNGAAP